MKNGACSREVLYNWTGSLVYLPQCDEKGNYKPKQVTLSLCKTCNDVNNHKTVVVAAAVVVVVMAGTAAIVMAITSSTEYSVQSTEPIFIHE